MSCVKFPFYLIFGETDLSFCGVLSKLFNDSLHCDEQPLLSVTGHLTRFTLCESNYVTQMRRNKGHFILLLCPLPSEQATVELGTSHIFS